MRVRNMIDAPDEEPRGGGELNLKTEETTLREYLDLILKDSVKEN